jgi:hypothetical protein
MQSAQMKTSRLNLDRNSGLGIRNLNTEFLRTSNDFDSLS